MRSLRILLLALLPVLGGVLASTDRARAQDGEGRSAVLVPGEAGCLTCHGGIEDMHPGFPLSCVDCHGGDGEARTMEDAHVAPAHAERADERVAPRDFDLAYRRFRNPMDLRVAEKVCGECHGELVQHLMVSLHGTTSGHLSDGFFENGLQKSRESLYAVFPTEAPTASKERVDLLVQPPALNPREPADELASHFPDLVRKECMQCHLWSEGRAVRGRVGFDGEYRGDGCAACHVTYRTDGLSESFDPTVDRVEPGHPRKHQLTLSPPTETCTACHFGDASIGLHFRGLSQLPPGAPAGPEIDGTTDALLHRSFFIDDPAVTPPDVHHAAGLACVDCHTLEGVMGDGRMPSKMEEATEITCEACHGSFTERADLTTERGGRLSHLFERDDEVWMRSKVTGAEHRIKQVVDVLDPLHPDHNMDAVDAMTGAHANVACYTCHAGWNVNFLGFHFYRNEALTQLDLLTGRRTPGRVTTQEKVFTTWKSFYAGLDERGRVAPYLTGFSTMGTVDDADGNRVLDQVLPVTENGLSGLSMIHHQLHSTRPTARGCVECHRASETWGLGSANFRLGRGLVFAADRRGIELYAFDRENPTQSVALGRIVQPDVVDLEIVSEPLQGHARTLFVTEGKRGLHVIDVSEPRAPRRLAFHRTVEPRGLAPLGDHMLVADGEGGLKVFEVSDPARPSLRATVPMVDAHDVEVRWPHAYVADGRGGVVVVDVRTPTRPRIVGGLDVAEGGIVDLDVLFQYSRPTVDGQGEPADARTPARRLLVALDRTGGPVLIDATEPTQLFLVEPARGQRSSIAPGTRTSNFRGLALRSHVDLASPQGGERTTERDVLYLLEERDNGQGELTFLFLFDVSDPTRPERLNVERVALSTEMLGFGAWYNPPFLRPLVFAPGEQGVRIVDVTNSSEYADLGSLPGMQNAYVVAVEAFPLDAMLDPDGRRLKDVSHPESRWLLRGEIDRVLSVDGEVIGAVGPYVQDSVALFSSARSLLARADADHSGVLTGEELEGPALRSLRGADVNGDGRLTLAELAAVVPDPDARSVAEGAPEAAPPPPAPDGRTAQDGDLARLVDGLDPHAFDRNGDRRLERREAEAAVFAALDLDGNGKLDAHEQSRAPGPGRDLRFAFQKREKALARRAFRLGDGEWAAFDLDGDGAVQLDVSMDAERRRRGEAPPRAEWPNRRQFPALALPPGFRAEDILEHLDTDGDGRLVKTEMRKRPLLFAQMDEDGSSVVDPDELERVESWILRWGLESTPDGFLERWDVDGNGEVDAQELPPVGVTLLRGRGVRIDPPR